MGTVDCLESKTMRLWDGTAAEGVEMTIRTKECLKDSYIGCSIAVNGVCLTATTIEDDKVCITLKAPLELLPVLRRCPSESLLRRFDAQILEC